MADGIVYIGRDKRFDFQATEQGPNGDLIPVPLPDGTRLYGGVKPSPAGRGTGDDPPLIMKRNAAAGGSDQESHVSDLDGGLFSVALQKGDTLLLQDGKTYQIDGTYILPDGTSAVAGIATFQAKLPVWRSPA
jgi:hypothetical protein